MEINLNGRADLVVENREKLRLVLELKIAENETEAKSKLEEAINQIKSRDYGNNGVNSLCKIKRYGVIFYRTSKEDPIKKFGVICKSEL